MDEPLYRQLFELEEAHWWFRGRRAVLRALAEGLAHGRPRVLDAGCGTGRNLQDYARLGEAEGVDPSPLAISFCRERGLSGVRESGLERLPFEDGRFGLIFSTDVLEHVEDDVAALRELHRVARAGAHLVVTVPAYRWLWSGHDDTHQHRRRYTRTELTGRARDAGWQVTHATYFNSVLLGPIALVRSTERLRPRMAASDYGRTPKVFNGALESIMRAEAGWIARGRVLPAGVSVGLVCRRPDDA